MTISTQSYLDLITSQHQGKPNYSQVITIGCQPFTDNLLSYERTLTAYEVSTATGSCLDVVGQWVGVDRHLNEPIAGVYFSFDDSSVGFDAGI